MDNMLTVWKARVRAARRDLFRVQETGRGAGSTVGTGALNRASERTAKRFACSGRTAVDYARQRWEEARVDQRALPLQSGAVAASLGSAYNVFHCAVCASMGHQCPATHRGISGEYWCEACKEGLGCRPGTGQPHRSGRISPREERLLRAKWNEEAA